jgi:3-methyladenine DNA glycosylase/8-oxoguanine DNA glycosylase
VSTGPNGPPPEPPDGARPAAHPPNGPPFSFANPLTGAAIPLEPRVSQPHTSMPPDTTVSLPLPGHYHLGQSLGAWRMGPFDPSFRVNSRSADGAFLTPPGPVAISLSHRGARVDVRSWGAGSEWLRPRLADLLGLHDQPHAFKPQHRVIAPLAKRFAGMHLVRAPLVFTRLVQIVLEQLVTSREALSSWGRLVSSLGEAAPGPLDLTLPPAPERLAGTSVDRLQALGILPRQGRTVILLARQARQIEAAAEQDDETLVRRLTALPGIGPWTTQYLLGSARGDPDAVPTGDYGLPHTVAWNLAGEPRGTDERMLDLLEPFRGHRYRVIRMLLLSGVRAPRRGPRRAPRDWRR